MRCTFCQNQGELHDVEAPAIKLCTACREKLQTHFAVVCTGCDRLFWLPKSPGNISFAAKSSDLSPKHLMDNPIIHEIKSCKKCLEVVQEFTVQASYVH